MEDLGYIVIGTKKEIEDFEREIDFSFKPTTDDKTAHYYESLTPSMKTIVNNLILSLTEHKEHFGYNLTQIQEWFKNNNDYELPIRKILVQICNNYSNIGITYNQKTVGELEKLFYRKKQQMFIDSDEMMIAVIDAVCDYFMISPDLLYKGHGKIYTVDEYYFQKDILEDIMTDDIFNNNDDWNTKLFFEKCQNVLLKRNPNHPPIIREQYAKIKKCGAYEILKSGKTYSPSLVATQNLIKNLYFLEINKDDDFIYPDYIETE